MKVEIKKTGFTFLLLLLVTISTNTKAQNSFIIAGQHGSNDYYYDFVPDTVIIQHAGYGYDSIDINHDGINDFVFTLFPGNGTLVSIQWESYITGLNNNKIAVGLLNPCNASTKMVHNLNLNDTVSGHLSWDSLGYLSVHNSTLNNCNASYSSGYIGLQLVSGMSVVYGWIHIVSLNESYMPSQYTLTLGEFAYENNPTGVEQGDKNNEYMIIFPNPSNDFIQVNTEIKKPLLLNIYDMLGKEMISTQEKIIDVSNLQNGIYFMSVKTNEGILTKKLIIQH
jgi:hypothetical protein